MALNGGGRPPAQGSFIPLDGNQKKWENEELHALKSPACDVSVYNFTVNEPSVKGAGTLASGSAPPSITGSSWGGNGGAFVTWSLMLHDSLWRN